MISPLGGAQTQYVNIMNGFGYNLGNYTFPGSEFNLNRTWGKDELGTIYFSISTESFGADRYGYSSNSTSLSGVYNPGYYYGDGMFMPSMSNIEYSTTDYINFRTPASGRVEYSPFNVEDLVFGITGVVGLMKSWLANFMAKEFVAPMEAMMANTVKQAAKEFAEGMAIMARNEGMQVGTGIANSRALGIAGEKAVGITGPKTAIQVAGRTRVPDRITQTALEEVKNVKHLNLTRQLSDFNTYSHLNNLDFILYTRPNTTFSKPLQQLINNGVIKHRYIPGY
jgi:hypothetical protein